MHTPSPASRHRTRRCASSTALILALALVAGACGSTARQRTAAGGRAGGQDEFSIGTSTSEAGDGSGSTSGGSASGGGRRGSSGGGSGTSGAGSSGSGSGPGGGGGGSGGGGGGGGGGSGGGGGGGGSHPGVTDSQIAVGFVYVTGYEEFARGLGGEASGGDTKGQIEAVVKTINDNGGIAGRSVRLLTYEFRIGGSMNGQLQAACDYFTQDHKVFAVGFNNGGSTGVIGDVLYECLADRGVVYIETSLAGDSENFARHPNMAYAPGSPSADRAVAAQIDGLVAAGWFGSSPVIGVHALDRPMYRRIYADVVKPRLAAHGLSVEEEAFITLGDTGPEGAGDYPGHAARFARAGVTHVISYGGAHFAIFAAAAEPQGWRPKWSIDSDMAPINWFDSDVMPDGQKKGVLGIGWAPSRDVRTVERGGPVNAADTRCREIMQANGHNPNVTTAWINQLTACGMMFFLEWTLPAAPEITPAGVAHVTAGLAEYSDPATWQSGFGANRRDARVSYRMLGYVEACDCLRYLSDLRRMP